MTADEILLAAVGSQRRPNVPPIWTPPADPMQPCGPWSRGWSRCTKLPAVSWNSLSSSRPTSDQLPSSEKSGTVIGPYKLLEQIGEGGFGLVFMAEQTAAPPQGRAQGHQAWHGLEAGHRPLRGRAAGAGSDGSPQHRPGPRRRHHGHRPALFRHGAGQGHLHHAVLRRQPADDARTAGAVRLGLPGGAARPPEGGHPPRSQALQRAGDAARR